MKNKIITGIASIILFAVPLVSFASFDQNLSYGSRGSAVKELQDFLVDQGVFTGQSTGSFFSLTQKAVIAFQKANNISPASGYFGTVSRGVANQILATQLSGSNDQALQETGTTTPNTEPTLKDTLISQISALTVQIQALQLQLANLNTQSQQQTQIQQQTQQNLQQIQQNTAPVVGNVTPPVPVPPVPLIGSLNIDVVPNNSVFSVSDNGGQYTSILKEGWQFATVTLDASNSQEDVSLKALHFTLSSNGKASDLSYCNIFSPSGVEYSSYGGTSNQVLKDGSVVIGFNQYPLTIQKGKSISLNVTCDIGKTAVVGNSYSWQIDKNNWGDQIQGISQYDLITPTIGQSISTVTIIQ